MSLRPKLEKLWRSNKSIRKGDLEPLFIATVAKRKPREGAILLTDIRLKSTGEYLTDHVWLNTQYRWSSYEDDSLNSNVTLNDLRNKSTRKQYWGRQIVFTAQICPYNYYSKEFGLVYTERSYWYLYLD